MKKILVIAHTNLAKDPRPNRQIRLLAKDYIVHSLGSKKSGYENKFYYLKTAPFLIKLLRLPLLFFGLYSIFYWDKIKRNIVLENDYDLVIAHEVKLLPLALKCFPNTKILLDAHEYSPANFADQIIWRYTYGRYYNWLCTKYIPDCSQIITVSEGIAELYSQRFDVPISVITNAADYFDLTPQKVNPTHIKIIYHGNCSRSRKLELMIKAAKYFHKRFHLYLMLVVGKSNKLYYSRLKLLAYKNSNVHFIPPVNYEKLISFSNKFDIGIQFHPPVNRNLQFGLGNKFFEYIQSRLAIVIGPSVEMVKYVAKYNIGIVVKDFAPKSLADTINRLDETQIMNIKQESDKYAKEVSSDHMNINFLTLIDYII